MDDRWQSFVDAIESGDSDRVNDVIDEIGGMDLAERVALFDATFEDLRRRYEAAEDGYVRQSYVRVADQLVPGLAAVAALDSDSRTVDLDEATLREQNDAIRSFALTACRDDDGRVRQSAGRALEAVLRTDDALGDRDAIEAVVSDLDEMATAASGATAEHLRDTRDEARFWLQSDLGRLLDGVAEELGAAESTEK